MDLSTLKEKYIECYYADRYTEAMVASIDQYINSNYNDIPDEIFIEFTQAETNYAEIILQLIQQSDPEFLPNCFEAEVLTAHFFLNILNHYQHMKGISPLQLCKLFSDIESEFLDAPRNLPQGIAYYPEWLDNMYDACDWCDETWSVENTPHLMTAVQQQIGVIERWLIQYGENRTE